MQRYFAEHAVIDGDDLKLVRSTLSADDKGNLALYEDVEAELATLRSENERLKAQLKDAPKPATDLKAVLQNLRAMRKLVEVWGQDGQDEILEIMGHTIQIAEVGTQATQKG